MSILPDRTGQVWRSKSQFSDLEITITGWRATPDAEYYNGLWEFRAVDIYGKPFDLTVSEAMLKRNYRRVKEPAHG